MNTSTKTTANNNKINNINNNTRDVTITTINDHNKIPRVEKVVFDNRIKRKNVLALNEKVAAIREYEKRPVYKRIGRMFHCSPDQIKRIMQQKEAILNAWEQRTRKSRDAKTLEMKVVKVSMLGKAVYEWIRRMMYYKDILITDGLIQKMALQFKSAMGLQNFFPHREWCDKFRTTYKIPPCDSKILKIGYTQGHSVQIKDVMKDVLSECSPDAEDDDDDQPEYIDDLEEEEENGDCENDCITLDIDDGELRMMTKSKNTNTDKNVQSVAKNISSSNPVQIMSPAQLQGLRQLVALPIQTNGIPGMTQKVLVATPIVAPGQKQGSAPMTMTIIPLASLAQPSNTANSTVTQTASANLALSSLGNNSTNNYSNDQHVTVPTPILEIKKEIKTEPKDDEDPTAENSAEEEIKIKKEYLTDDDDASCTSVKIPQTQIQAQQSAASKHIVAIPLANRDMLEESTNDSLDDLSLSSLRKRIKIEGDSADQNTAERNVTSPPPLASISATLPALESAEMPPMPPLTKAPTQRNSPSANAILPTDQIPKLTPLSLPNRSSHKRRRSNDDQFQLPPIRSYAEGRKYLKLLEDFALERENFRLIGLITRADEVLRELDRKENNEDEDDVEID